MRDATNIWLGERNDLVEVYRILEICAAASGYVRSEDSGEEPRTVLSVWRDARNGGELEEVESLQQALPLDRQDILMVAYDEPDRGDEGARLFIGLICKAENVVERINMDGYHSPLTEKGDEGFESAKRQYGFVQQLHGRLDAVETVGYLGDVPDYDAPVYRFARDGRELRIAALEDGPVE